MKLKENWGLDDGTCEHPGSDIAEFLAHMPQVAVEEANISGLTRNWLTTHM